MVQLTQVLQKHIPKWMDLFERRVFLRKQAIFRLTYAMKGRYRNCYKRASINLYVQYRKEIEQRKKDRLNMRHLNSARIHAACEDLGYPFSKFIFKLPLVSSDRLTGAMASTSPLHFFEGSFSKTVREYPFLRQPV